MTTRAEQIRAKAQAIRAQQEPHAEPKRSTPKPRAKPVRRTVDLPASHHDQLSAWCNETARQLGKARVTGQDVLRTLVARLLTDETMARRIRQDLAEDQ